MKNLFGWFLMAMLGAGACFFLWTLLTYDYRWSSIWPQRFNLLRGLGTTVGISLASLVLSSAIGILLTCGQLSELRLARVAARGYVELIRGTPLLVQLLIGYYLVSDALGLDNKFVVGCLLLSLFSGAYLAEIFRGGVESVPRSQIDSARAVGFSGAQTYRYVIIPQAIRRVLPSVAGQFANLIKDSSLLSVIGLAEFTRAAQEANAATFSAFACYVPLALGYLALTLPVSWWSRSLEERFRYES